MAPVRARPKSRRQAPAAPKDRQKSMIKSKSMKAKKNVFAGNDIYLDQRKIQAVARPAEYMATGADSQALYDTIDRDAVKKSQTMNQRRKAPAVPRNHPRPGVTKAKSMAALPQSRGAGLSAQREEQYSTLNSRGASPAPNDTYDRLSKPTTLKRGVSNFFKSLRRKDKNPSSESGAPKKQGQAFVAHMNKKKQQSSNQLDAAKNAEKKQPSWSYFSPDKLAAADVLY